MTGEDLRRLDEIAPVGVAAGGRYLTSAGLNTMYGDSPPRT
jgi:hypothetical protein